MGFDIGSLTGVLGDVAKVLPSQNDILNQVVTGAAASVLLSGLKTDSGMNAIDPLHIFHKTESTPASTIIGKTIPASAFNALDAAGKAAVAAQGYSIVAG